MEKIYFIKSVSSKKLAFLPSTSGEFLGFTDISKTTSFNAVLLATGEDARQHLVSRGAAIMAMREIGREMNVKFKETSEGGLAVSMVECRGGQHRRMPVPALPQSGRLQGRSAGKGNGPVL